MSEDWPPEPPDEGVGVEAEPEREYFAMIMYHVTDDPRVNRQGKDAYVCIVRALGWRKDRSKRDQKLTRPLIASFMSISPDTFDRGVKNLEECGYLTVIRSRDPNTGNYNVSQYLLKDSHKHRLAARVLELEAENRQLRATRGEKTQVGTSPQIAARSDEDTQGEADKAGGDQSAICGMAPTCENADDPQVGSSPQHAEPPVRNLRNRQSAICGHTRESFCSCKREDEQRDQQSPPVLAVGELTVGEAPAGEAPAAQPTSSFTGRSLIASVARYRAAPGWAKARLAALATAALEHFGLDAIVAFACLVEPDLFKDHQHIPEFRHALRLLAQAVRLGQACRHCGKLPTECATRTPEATTDDLALLDSPWTEEDQAAWERTLARLAPTNAELDDAQEA